MWITSDGSSWHRAEVEHTSSDTGTIELLVAKDGLALMSSEPDGDLGTIQVTLTLSSVDGSAWSRVDEPWGQVPQSHDMVYDEPIVAKTLTSDGTRMVVLGLAPGAEPIGWVSADGTTWDVLSVLSGGGELYNTWPPIPESLAITPGGLVLWETRQCDPGVWCGMTFAAGTAVGD